MSATGHSVWLVLRREIGYSPVMNKVLKTLLVVALTVGAFAQPIRVGGNVQAANIAKKVNPVYPVAMKAQGLEATVMLDVTISKEGVPVTISVRDTSVPHEFSDAAIEAVKQWQYKPTLLNGEPVEVLTTVQINFTLAK